jgi:nucleolar protein 56
MEERLKFLASGVKPRKNKVVMGEVIEELKKEGLFYGDKVQVARGSGDGDHHTKNTGEDVAEEKEGKKSKKDKKDKKRKHSEVEEDKEVEVEEPKKKKSKKSKD